MQERMERWLCYWFAKPISWVIFGIWLALNFVWFSWVWCTRKASEKWANWWAKKSVNGMPTIRPNAPIVQSTKRTNKHQVA